MGKRECHITAIISAFQADDAGSTPATRFYATVAQLVEHRFEEPGVGGSIPSGGI